MCAQQNKNVVPSRIQNQSWLQDWWQDFIQLWHNLSPQEALFGGVQGEVSLGKRQQGIFLHSLNEMPSSHIEREEVASKETRICSDKHRAGISSVCLASNERGSWSKLCWMWCQGWFAAAACWGLGIDSAWWRLVMVYVTSVFKKNRQAEQKEEGRGLQAQEWRVQLQVRALLCSQRSFTRTAGRNSPKQKVEQRKEKFCKHLKRKNCFFLLIFCILTISNNLHTWVPCYHDDSSPGFSWSYQYYLCAVFLMRFIHLPAPASATGLCPSATSRLVCHTETFQCHIYWQKYSLCFNLWVFLLQLFYLALHRSKPCWTHGK